MARKVTIFVPELVLVLIGYRQQYHSISCCVSWNCSLWCC